MSLEFRHIAHAYGGVPALRDVSFNAPSGAITCLLGSSGCGKSTLLALAAGLLEVQSGTIKLDGEVLADPTRHPPPERRPVGLMFQDGALFPHMTVAENIAFGMAPRDKAGIADWIDRVRLSGKGKRYPHELSGGEQQRAALARAMAHDPRVLLMDEPFANIDIVRRRSLRAEFRAILKARGTTTVLVTHDPDEALELGDHIALVEAGQVTQAGPPQALLETPARPSVGVMLGNGVVLAARPETRGGRTVFATGLGTFEREAIGGQVPEGEPCELLFYPDAVGLVAAEAGEGDGESQDGALAVVDAVLRGRRWAVTLANSASDAVDAGGQRITVLSDEPVDPARRYRLVPHRASMRAFPAS
ncbi:ABC transporter ATP-binding protein [Qipengyuania nanhaisediminis]|uniref:ABC transporter ATP-binding protein n=1 Tax=Qipengyuania nanhaisediminis TaxID=604088 RepID=UPI0038B3D65B